MEEIELTIPRELMERIEPILAQTGETLEAFVLRVVSQGLTSPR